MAVVFPVSAFFPARRFHPVRPGSGQAADSGMPVRFVLAGRLYETLAIFPVPVVAVFLWTGCRPVTVVLAGAGYLFLPEGCFGFRLRFDVPASGKRFFRRALACRDGEAGFWPECLCSVRAAISRLATCPDAVFPDCSCRGGMGKSRDGLSVRVPAGRMFCHRAKSCAIKRSRLAFRHFSVFGQGMFGEVVYAGRSRISGCPGTCFSGSGLKVFCGKNDLDIEPSNAHCIVSSTVCFYHRATNV